MRSGRSVPLVALLAAVVLGAGCGGDDETTTGSEPAAGANTTSGAVLSGEAFAAQANSICKQGSKVTEQAASQILSGSAPTDARLQAYADVFVPAVQGQIDAIRALPAPTDQAEEVTAFLDEAEGVLGEIETDPALLGGDSDPFEAVRAQADELGLTECAS